MVGETYILMKAGSVPLPSPTSAFVCVCVRPKQKPQGLLLCEREGQDDLGFSSLKTLASYLLSWTSVPHLKKRHIYFPLEDQIRNLKAG